MVWLLIWGYSTESVLEAVSATSCTWSLYRENSGGSCTAAAGKGTEIFVRRNIQHISQRLAKTGLSPPGTAPVHAPEKGVPAPGTDDGIVKDEDRGIESVMDDSEKALTDPSVSPRLSKFSPAVMILFFCWIVASVSFYFFLRQTSVSFSIKQVCNSAMPSPHSSGYLFCFILLMNSLMSTFGLLPCWFRRNRGDVFFKTTESDSWLQTNVCKYGHFW